MAKAKQVKVSISPRMQMLLDGELSIEELDDDEIFKGQIKDKNGKFQGTRTAMIPRKFYDQAVVELMRRWQARLNADLEPMRQVLLEMAQNPRVSADARYKSAVYLMERAAGKVPEKTDLKIEVAKWEKDIANGVIFD